VCCLPTQILTVLLLTSPIRLGLKVAIADIDEAALTALEKELKTTWGEANVIALPTDVSKLADVERLRDRVYDTWGEVRFIAPRSRMIDSDLYPPAATA
jgi:NAD(P)-dependent dehydrogenase (short-subunit alcohol dehydrogenase family)